jgi:hypothetical protein
MRGLALFGFVISLGLGPSEVHAQMVSRYSLSDCPLHLCDTPKYFVTAMEACQDLAVRIGPALDATGMSPCGNNPPTVGTVVGCPTPPDGYGIATIFVKQYHAQHWSGLCGDRSGNVNVLVWHSRLPAPPQPKSLIELAGASTTQALPAGPALPQVATVTREGMPVASMPVSIRVDGNLVATGMTDFRGEYRFMYVPPIQRAATVVLTGLCTDCSNTATKTIVVEHCDVCTAGVAQ